MKQRVRFALLMTPEEKQALVDLAEAEGEWSQSAVLRRLIREAAKQRGLWPPTGTKEQEGG